VDNHRPNPTYFRPGKRSYRGNRRIGQGDRRILKIERPERETISSSILLTKTYRTRSKLRYIRQRITSSRRMPISIEGIPRGSEIPSLDILRPQELNLLDNNEETKPEIGSMSRDVSPVQF